MSLGDSVPQHLDQGRIGVGYGLSESRRLTPMLHDMTPSVVAGVRWISRAAVLALEDADNDLVVPGMAWIWAQR